MNWKRIIAVFVCMLVVNLPIVMADAYSNGSVNPAPVAAGVLIVGLAIAVPAVMSYIVSAGLASGAVAAVCSETDAIQGIYTKGTCTDDDDTGEGCINGCDDECIDSTMVREVNCVSGQCSYTPHTCPDGSECVDGACTGGSGFVSGSADVEVISITGMDGVEGYRKDIDDYTLVKAQATFGDATIVTAGNLKIKAEGYYEDFDSCTKMDLQNMYLCEYQSGMNTGYYLEGSLSFDVELFADPSDTSALPYSSDSAVIYIDSVDPEIKSFGTPQQNGKNITFSYILDDEADYSSKSSGIVKAEYHIGSYKIGEMVFDEDQEWPHTESFELQTSSPDSEESMELTITAHDGVGNKIQAKSLPFIIDNEAPEIIDGSFFLQDRLGNAILSLPEDGLKGGVMGILIKSNNGIENLKALVSPLSDSYEDDTWMDGTCGSPIQDTYNCVWSGLEVDKSGNMNSIMINASDDLGNNIMGSVGDYLITVERTAPVVRAGSLKVVYAGTDLTQIHDESNEVKYLGNYSKDISRVKVDIYLNLTDDYPGLNTQGVILDLSEYGGNKITYASKCTHMIYKVNITNEVTDQFYNCTFRNVELELSSDLTKLDFTFIDFFGNENEHSAGQSILFDNDGPVVEYLGAGHTYDGTEWVGPNDVLVVRIKEAGSGINETNVKFIISGKEVDADNCIAVADLWTCEAPLSDELDGKTHLSDIPVSVEVKDNVGYTDDNETRTETTLKLDNTDPVVKDTKIFSTAYIADKLTSGEGMLINVTIEDDIFVTGTANISSLNCEAEGDVRCPVDEETYGDCTYNSSGEELWTCEWAVDEIYRRGGIDAAPSLVDFSFNITDIVGNSININLTKSREVYGLIVDTEPDNFEAFVDVDKAYPYPVNRLTLSLMPPEIPAIASFPFYIKYLTGKSGITVLKQEVTDCEMLNGSVSIGDYFSLPDRSDAELILARDKQKPYESDTIPNYNRAELHFQSLQGEPEAANDLFDFNVTCILKIYQLKGGKIYKVPERENITFPLKFIDSALDGTPDQELVDTLQAYRDESLLLDQQWITKGAKLFKLLEGICTIASTIYGLMSVFATGQVLGASMYETGKNAPGTPWGAALKGAGWGVFKVSCYIHEAIGFVIEPLWHGAAGFGKHGLEKCTKVQTPADVARKAKNLKDASKAAAEGLKDATEKQRKDAWNQPTLSGEYLCKWISCEFGRDFWNKYTGGDLLNRALNGTAASKVMDKWNSRAQAATGSQALSFENSITPQNSIIFSVGTACLPGIFYNLDKYRQIQCTYVNCLKEAAIYGGDVSSCDQKKGESWCLLLWGEAAEVIGPLRILKAIGDSTSNFFINIFPGVLHAVAEKLVCKKEATFAKYEILKSVVCDLPRAIYSGIDAYENVKSVLRYGDPETWKPEHRIDDECDRAMCDGTWTDGACVCTTNEECYNGECVDGECEFDWA